MTAFGRRMSVVRKADSTPVTELDGAAESAIRAAVREHRPDDGVLGEEQGLVAGASGRVWVVDPIDGTRMFAEGIPLWTTLIGLRDESGVFVAVADAPAIGERASARRGEGAWMGGRRLQVSDVDSLGDSFVLHSSVEEFVAAGTLDRLGRLVSAARGSRGISDAWAHLLVARGAAEAMLEATECHEWDWAASGLIVTEAGGRVGTLDGSDPTPGCRLLVTNGRVDDQVRDAW